MEKTIKGTKRLKLNGFDGDYEGDLINGKAHGKGKLTLEVHEYEGEWVEDKFTGKGKHTVKGELEYEGEWFDNEFHGKGILYRYGDVYNCNFIKGRIYGKGKVTFKNGAVYEGDLFGVGLHGMGKLVHPDGKVENGHWYMDKFMGEGEEGKAKIEAIEHERAEQSRKKEEDEEYWRNMIIQDKVCP